MNLFDAIQAVTSVVGAAAILSAHLPYPKVSKALGVARTVLDFVGHNFGNAKNAKSN
ncbi:MAG: hypothetical protein K2Q15_05305 [Burkholderiales bacterium]|jgi:precorrin-4 methylase|nr:hypothetical protein [Burkholderiales bacterium]